MKKILPILLVLILVIAGALYFYPKLREDVGEPTIQLQSDSAKDQDSSKGNEEKKDSHDAVDPAQDTTTQDTSSSSTQEEGSNKVGSTTETTSSDKTNGADTNDGDPNDGGTKGGEAATSTTEEPPKIEAPDFTIYDLEGKAVQYKDLADDKVVLLNFWASWCPPCKAEMPHLQTVYEDYKDDVSFIIINSTDGSRETREKALAFLEDKDYSMPIYLDEDRMASALYGVRSLPSTVLIDSEGYIIGGIMGALNEEQFRDVLDQALEISKANEMESMQSEANKSEATTT